MEKILTKDECRELIESALKRSNNLYQTSKILFNNEQYPVSYSLFVLSMEELSKAFLCILGSQGILEIKKRHLFKHENKQKFIGMLQMLFLMMHWEELHQVFFESMSDPNFKPKTEKDTPKELNEKMTEFMDFVFFASEFKEIGFYADLDEDGKAIIPDTEITKETFPSFYFEESSTYSKDLDKNVFVTNIIKTNETFQKIIPHELINKIFPIPADKIINQIKTTVIKSED